MKLSDEPAVLQPVTVELVTNAGIIQGKVSFTVSMQVLRAAHLMDIDATKLGDVKDVFAHTKEVFICRVDTSIGDFDLVLQVRSQPMELPHPFLAILCIP